MRRPKRSNRASNGCATGIPSSSRKSDIAGKTSVAAAWLSLISTQDIVGLKVYCGPGSASGTRPAVVAAVIESLLKAHVATNHIIVWDRRLVDLKNSGFDELAARYGVLMEACSADSYDQKVFYEPTSNLFIWTSQFSTDVNNGNAVRIFVAHGGSGVTSGTWQHFDLVPSQVGWPVTTTEYGAI